MSCRLRAARGALAALLTFLAILGTSRGVVFVTAAGFGLAAAPASGRASSAKTSQEYWQKRYRDLKELVARLTQELDQARAEYSRKRHQNRLRGEARAELRERIEELEKQLAKAEGDLAAFPERARQAGALPGWFRDP